MLSWMFYRMGECRIRMGTFLVFQPYIMTLILSKARDFRGGLEMIHNRYQPYKNNKAFLTGAPSPPNNPLLGEGDEEHACRGVLSGGVFGLDSECSSRMFGCSASQSAHASCT